MEKNKKADYYRFLWKNSNILAKVSFIYMFVYFLVVIYLKKYPIKSSSNWNIVINIAHCSFILDNSILWLIIIFFLELISFVYFIYWWVKNDIPLKYSLEIKHNYNFNFIYEFKIYKNIGNSKKLKLCEQDRADYYSQWKKGVAKRADKFICNEKWLNYYHFLLRGYNNKKIITEVMSVAYIPICIAILGGLFSYSLQKTIRVYIFTTCYFVIFLAVIMYGLYLIKYKLVFINDFIDVCKEIKNDKDSALKIAKNKLGNVSDIVMQNDIAFLFQEINDNSKKIVVIKESKKYMSLSEYEKLPLKVMGKDGVKKDFLIFDRVAFM